MLTSTRFETSFPLLSLRPLSISVDPFLVVIADSSELMLCYVLAPAVISYRLVRGSDIFCIFYDEFPLEMPLNLLLLVIELVRRVSLLPFLDIC